MHEKTIPIIDGHVHIWSLDEFDGLLELIDQEGFMRVNVLSLTACGDRFYDHNLLVLLLKLLLPKKIFGFGGLHYPRSGMPEDHRSPVRQVERLVSAGFDGVKMIEGKPDIHKRIGTPLDSPSYAPMFTFLEENNVPLLLHAGDPEEFWDPGKTPEFAKKCGWTYWDGTFATKEKITAEVENIVVKHPDLKIIVPHFFFLSGDFSKAEHFLGTYPNLYFDVTPGSEMYINFSKDPERWHDFFSTYDEKILFGTDNLSEDNSEKIAAIRRFLETGDVFNYWDSEIRGISLSEATLHRIYRDNFVAVVGGSVPSPVEGEEVSRMVEEIAAYAAERLLDVDGWRERLRRIVSRLDEIRM